jgi:predicted HD phosphohydrolase
MGLSLDEIAALFAARGDRMYSGEPVTQLQHALQCGQLAEQDGASDELVVAAFLHDLGHLINDQGETPTLRGVDDRRVRRSAIFARPFR